MFETPYTFGVTTLVEQVNISWLNINSPTRLLFMLRMNTNLNTLAFTLTNVVSCALLQLVTPFNGTYFGHVMFKTCHYAINDIKIGFGMKKMSVIEAQSALQKTITIYIDKEVGDG